MARRDAYVTTARVLSRLGTPARAVKMPQVRVGDHRVVMSRAVVEGADWLHLGAGTTHSVAETVRDVALASALADRIPAVGVVASEDLSYVRMPAWAFAALMRMVTSCSDRNQIETVLAESLPLSGVTLSPTDRAIGSGVLSGLESGGRS